MPTIDFCFQGWVRGAEITHATDKTGARVDVQHMQPQELRNKLAKGELFISLADHLSDNHKAEIELTDYEVR